MMRILATANVFPLPKEQLAPRKTDNNCDMANQPDKQLQARKRSGFSKTHRWQDPLCDFQIGVFSSTSFYVGESRKNGFHQTMTYKEILQLIFFGRFGE